MVDMPQPPALLRRLRHNVHAWMRTRLWAQVVAGLVAGIAVGVLLGPETGIVAPKLAAAVGAWLTLPGKLFLGLISLALVPLVFGSLVNGLIGAPSGDELRHIGWRLAVFVIVTTTLAAGLGIALTQTIAPGTYIDLPPTIAAAATAAPAAPAPLDGALLTQKAPEMVARLLPTNAGEVFLDQDLLAVVVLAILTGIACRIANRDRIATLLHFIDGMLELSMTVVRWAMYLAPWAVFGLMADLVLRIGAASILGMAAYVGTVLLGLTLLMVVYLLLVGTLGRRNPFAFLRNIASVQLLAFSTSSSAAVMPVSLQTAVKQLGTREDVANMIIPMGATVNMAGTALYQATAVIFLAQMSGIELSLPALAAIVGTLVAASIGAPGTPGVSIVILSNIVAGFGIPTAGLVLILGVDRILDMSRTVVNVTGDLTLCALLADPPEPAPAPAVAG